MSMLDFINRYENYLEKIKEDKTSIEKLQNLMQMKQEINRTNSKITLLKINLQKEIDESTMELVFGNTNKESA